MREGLDLWVHIVVVSPVFIFAGLMVFEFLKSILKD